MPNQDRSTAKLLEAAMSAQRSGKVDKAIKLYGELLETAPNHADAWHYFGLCHRNLGKWEEAITAIQKSINLKPDNASACNSMGATLCALKRFDVAEKYLLEAIRLQPDNAEAYRNLGLICCTRQEFDAAIKQFQKGLAHAPNHLELLKSMGNALLQLDQTGKALLVFEKALSINARDANLQSDTGIAYQMERRFREALEFNSLAISIEPGENRHWTAFCACIDGLVPDVHGNTEDKLSALIDKGDHAPYELMMPVAGALFHRPEFREIILRHTKPSEAEASSNETNLSDIVSLSRIPLFLKLLSEYPITNILIENVLTRIRKHILLGTIPVGELPTSFMCALAQQCFNNEYSYLVTSQEKKALEVLVKDLKARTANGITPDLATLALIGCYDPLFTHFAKRDLPAENLPSDAAEMLRRQLIEPAEEAAIRDKIPDWTADAGDISDSVRAQYEENPYPRWTRTITGTKARTVSACLKSEPLNMDLRNYKDPSSPEILVAGCGTGQHAIQPASRFANARVTAIDLSKSSLAYAKRQTAKLGITNIEFGRADILKLDALGRDFDIIECSGVLHHLKDPFAGWQILTRLLRPAGLMKIGLYSELARKDVVAGRKLVSERGFEATADDMRQCRQVVIEEAGKGNPDMLQLSRRSDFFSLSAFRDLIFHVQEHRYDLIMVKDQLAKLGLEFIDFEMPFAGDLKRHRESISGRTADERLLLWHEYEQQRPDTFRGMYQFWCQKTEG